MSLSGDIVTKNRYECTANCCDRELLGEPLNFPTATGLTAPNRFMKAAMSERLCEYDKAQSTKSGIPSKALVELYKKFAQGGCGILVSGCIMVDPDHLEAPGNVIIHKSVETPERKAAFQEWTKAGKANGGLMIAQLMHPGAEASEDTDKSKLDPSKVKKAELEILLEEFIRAGLYAEIHGFDGVEVPCAWNFTLGTLTSAEWNQETDEYNVSLADRTKALFKIIDGIRIGARNNKRFIIGVKLDASNLAPGFNSAEFAVFVKKLEDHGVDYISFFGGNLESLLDLPEDARQSLNAVDATFLSVATTLKKQVRKVKIFLNSGPTLCDMSELLRKGWADGVILARSLAAEPSFPHDLLYGVVTGGIKSLIEDDDEMTANEIAGTQMWQHATNNVVMDASNPEHLAKFRLCLAKHNKDIKFAPLNKPVIGYAKLQL